MRSCLFGEDRDTWIWRFTAPHTASYRFSTQPAGNPNVDTVLEISRACDTPRSLITCDDDGGQGAFSAARVQIDAGHTVYVKVSSYGEQRRFSFELRVTERQ